MNLNPSFPSKSLQLPQAPGFHPNITGIPRSLCCMLSCLARCHGWIKWQSLWGPLVKASMVSMGLYPDLKHRKWYLKTLNLIPYIPWFHGDHGDEVQNLKIPRLSRFYRRNVRKKPLHPRVSSFSMFPFFPGRTTSVNPTWCLRPLEIHPPPKCNGLCSLVRLRVRFLIRQGLQITKMPNHLLYLLHLLQIWALQICKTL